MSKSEIAIFREQQAVQEQAAKHGLYGVAAVASHASITTRMQNAATHLLELIEQGRHEEVIGLMERPDWGLEGKLSACSTMTNERD